MKIPLEKRIYQQVSKRNISSMKKLRTSGLSYGKIAIIIGVSKPTVMWHLNQEYRERCLTSHKQWAITHKEQERLYSKRAADRFKKILGIPPSTAFDREHPYRAEKKRLHYWQTKGQVK